MTTRNGKIARLPFEIREELNHRLLGNEPAKAIIAWLNADSTVKLFLERLFEGRPITEQNISEWRQGGYEEWLTYRSYLDNVSGLSEKAARAALTNINAEHLLMVITAAYADLLERWDSMPEIAFNRRLIVLQNLTSTALAIRGSEQRDARLKLDRDRVEILRERCREKYRSSASSRSSSHTGPSSVAHPCHPKAAEIRRPPVPQPEDDGMTDQEWLATPPAYRPNASGASSYGPSIIPTVIPTIIPATPPPPCGSRSTPPQTLEVTPNDLD